MSSDSAITLQPTDALLVIDMQMDFLPNGTLAVTGTGPTLAEARDIAYQTINNIKFC